MRIEIRKKISEYPKQKWDFLLMLFNSPAWIVCFVLLLLLLVCETYYSNKVSTEPNTTYIGGGFSLFGSLLIYGAMIISYKGRQKSRKFMAPLAENSFVMLDNESFERGVENLWSITRKWRMLTGYDERNNAFWLKFGEESLPVFKYEFEQPADIDEFREFLNKKITRT